MYNYKTLIENPKKRKYEDLRNCYTNIYLKYRTSMSRFHCLLSEAEATEEGGGAL